MRARIVTAFFGGPLEAERAAARLLASGLAPGDVRVFPKVVTRADEYGLRVSSKVPEGAALGGALGGIVGAVAGALAAGGAIVVPHVGVVVAGPVVAGLAGAGLAGAIGTLVGAVLGARVPELELAYLPDAIRMGGALLTVRCRDGHDARVRDELARAGARITASRAARS